MPKAILTCGKICCGKTTYANEIVRERKAVLLSLDEIMLTLFPHGAGEMHDLYVMEAEKYLLHLSANVIAAGCDVVLDWGLWTRAQRERIRSFYQKRGIAYEIHYLKISEEMWINRIAKRNRERPEGTYYVDEGLIRKFNALFQEPETEERDIRTVPENHG